MKYLDIYLCRCTKIDRTAKIGCPIDISDKIFDTSGEIFVNNLRLGFGKSGKALIALQEGGILGVRVEAVLDKKRTAAARLRGVADNGIIIRVLIVGVAARLYPAIKRAHSAHDGVVERTRDGSVASSSVTE